MTASDDRSEPARQPDRRLRTRRSWRRTVRGYIRLPHLIPVLVVELATALFAVVAWQSIPPIGVLIPLLLAMLGGQLAIGAINELADLPFDARDKPSKPLPSGEVSVRGARCVVIAGLALLTAFGLTFGLPAFGLLALGTGSGIAYDLWLKRTAWSWLPYFLALPLLPIWVFTALGRFSPALLLLYPLGALATAGVHFAQALPDAAIDRGAGLPTATSRLGTRRTFLAAWMLTLSAPALAWAGARVYAPDSASAAIELAAAITVLLLLGNAVAIRANRRVGTALCFPLIALSTLANGLAWTLTVAG